MTKRSLGGGDAAIDGDSDWRQDLPSIVIKKKWTTGGRSYLVDFPRPAWKYTNPRLPHVTVGNYKEVSCGAVYTLTDLVCNPTQDGGWSIEWNVLGLLDDNHRPTHVTVAYFEKAPTLSEIDEYRQKMQDAESHSNSIARPYRWCRECHKEKGLQGFPGDSYVCFGCTPPGLRGEAKATWCSKHDGGRGTYLEASKFSITQRNKRTSVRVCNDCIHKRQERKRLCSRTYQW